MRCQGRAARQRPDPYPERMSDQVPASEKDLMAFMDIFDKKISLLFISCDIIVEI
jgi:hypothetical protein